MIRHARSASASRPLLALVLALMLPVPAALAQSASATTAAKSKTVPDKKPAVKTAAAKTVPAQTTPAATAPTKTAASKTTPAKATPGKAAAAITTPATKAATGKTAAGATTTPDSTKPVLVASYGDWGAYAAQTGKSKTCYALAQPKTRQPATLTRNPGYIFISTRPAEGVRNEVSFVMGFDIKSTPGKDPKAQVGNTSIDMVAQGGNLWVKNAAQESQLIDLMKKNQQLIVSAASLKGNVTTDTYSLAGLAQAIDRVQKECP